MAELSNADRTRIHRALMRSQGFGWAGLKADLRSAVDAADTYADVMGAARPATSYNAALPLPFRTDATAEQKALLFATVSAARVSADHVRALLGVGGD